MRSILNVQYTAMLYHLAFPGQYYFYSILCVDVCSMYSRDVVENWYSYTLCQSHGVEEDIGKAKQMLWRVVSRSLLLES